MDYFTIYSTHDSTEVDILKNLFEQENIQYRVLGEATNSSAKFSGSGATGIRIQVKEEDREKARDIVDKSGFQGNPELFESTKTQRPPRVNKWVLIFLAALVLVIVGLLITWFMNVD